MMPGVPERRTHSYVRHGTTTLFAALDVASGFVKNLDVHIVMDKAQQTLCGEL